MEGVELRARRNRMGLSIQTLAKIIGMNPKHLGAMEAGTRDVSPYVADKVHEEYSKFIELADLFEDRALNLLENEIPREVVDSAQAQAFYVYASRAEFEAAGGYDRYGLGWAMHSALVAEVAFRIEESGYPVEIVTFKGRPGEPSNDPTRLPVDN